MKKKIHVYNITMSNGEHFKDVQIEGPISHKYSTIAEVFIPAKDVEGQTVELNKYQVVKAELVNIED